MNYLIRLVLTLTLAAFAIAGMAHAQASRTWVSGVGDDANPCSRTAPCKTFAGAISKTAAFGEINAIDPGGFGAVTITKSISIIVEGATGGVLAAGTNGIIVNLLNTTDNVVLQGLDIEGFNTGLNGIRMIGKGDLVVKKSDIRGFTGFGIDVQSATGARVLVQDTTITGNAGGINIKNLAGNAGTIVTRSVIDKNTNFGIQVDGVSSVAILSDNVIEGSTNALVVINSGKIISYGNNVIRAGAPTSTELLQ